MNLLNISEGSYLAMHSLAMIAGHQPERMNVKILAEELNASQAHLAKVFQKLGKAGIVKSVRGPSGGFVLDKPADEISFLNIFEIMEGQVQRSNCPAGKGTCPFSSCIFSSELSGITNEIYEAYSRIKLSDFEGTKI